MSAFQSFAEGDYNHASQLLAQIGENRQHNILITEYYSKKCQTPAILLKKLKDLQESSQIGQYNQAVLNFQLQQYGKALSILQQLSDGIEGLDDFLAIKTCLLLAETYLILQMTHKVPEVIELLESTMQQVEILKTSPEEDIFSPIILTPWIRERPITSVNHFEYRFIIELLQSRTAILQGSTEQARKLLTDAEQSWGNISQEHYDPQIFEILQAHKNIATNALQAQIFYNEGNLYRTLALLNEVQQQVIPPCLKTGQMLQFFNSLSCVHLRLGKPHLARLYINKAMNIVDNPKQNITQPLKAVTSHSQMRRVELLYNSALGFLKSRKPKQAMECLQEIAPVKHNSAIFWYRFAESYVLMHLHNLEKGRRNMLSDICVEEKHNLYVLPAKTQYQFSDDDGRKEENSLEHAIRCLRNAQSIVQDSNLRVHILLLLAYSSLDSQPSAALQAAQQLLKMDLSEQTAFTANMYAAEALLILGRPKQAMDYLKENNKEFKIRCHSTLASNAAVFTEDISIRGIQLLNQASVLLQADRFQEAKQQLSLLLTHQGFTQQIQSQGPSIGVPAPILSICIYMALRQGNHQQAASILENRKVWAGMDYSTSRSGFIDN